MKENFRKFIIKKLKGISKSPTYTYSPRNNQLSNIHHVENIKSYLLKVQYKQKNDVAANVVATTYTEELIFTADNSSKAVLSQNI